MADIPPLDAGATPDEQAQWLIANGIMVEITDDLGRSFMMPAAVSAVGTPVMDPPLNIKAPVLTGIEPVTATVASLVNLRCYGQFTFSSGIFVDGAPVATTYVSDSELMATLPGGTYAAGVVPVTVVDGDVASDPVDFTYT